jgi:hypothetical protein
MWEDPIVAEVHRAREKMAADCNYDISAYFVGLRNRQPAPAGKLVRQVNLQRQSSSQSGLITPAPGGPMLPEAAPVTKQ